jgi:hypothetical protein
MLDIHAGLGLEGQVLERDRTGADASFAARALLHREDVEVATPT